MNKPRSLRFASLGQTQLYFAVIGTVYHALANAGASRLSVSVTEKGRCTVKGDEARVVVSLGYSSVFVSRPAVTDQLCEIKGEVEIESQLTMLKLYV